MRLIDADALMETLKIMRDMNKAELDDSIETSLIVIGIQEAYCSAIEAVQDAPTIEAESVVHGKWITKLIGERPYCSACYKTHDCFQWTPRYCPNCGAKMDGVSE